MAAWACGEAITCVYEIALHVRIPEPSVADAGFLLSYGLIVCGLLAFVRTPRASSRRFAARSRDSSSRAASSLQLEPRDRVGHRAKAAR